MCKKSRQNARRNPAPIACLRRTMSCPFDERNARNQKAILKRRRDEEEALVESPCIECKKQTLEKCPCGLPICATCATTVIKSSGFVTCGGQGCMLVDSAAVIEYAGPLVHVDDLSTVILATKTRWNNDKKDPTGYAKEGYQLCTCGEVVQTGIARRLYPLTFTCCTRCGAQICDFCGQTNPEHPHSFADPSNPYSTDPTLPSRAREFCRGARDAYQKERGERQFLIDLKKAKVASREDQPNPAREREQEELKTAIKARLQELVQQGGAAQAAEEPKPKSRRTEIKKEQDERKDGVM